ncbi:MAG TPA: hypothetical protein VGI20_07320 [Rhizomicrobium sp.]
MWLISAWEAGISGLGNVCGVGEERLLGERTLTGAGEPDIGPSIGGTAFVRAGIAAERCKTELISTVDRPGALAGKAGEPDI